MISKRAKKLIASPSPIGVAHFRCAADPYSPKNPNGFINLGTAENYLVWDLLEPKLNQARGILESDSHYCPSHGLSDFREAVAAFLNRKFSTAFKAENLLIANGATAILDMISYALCEAGEGIIIPSPFYPGFKLDLSGRAEVALLPAPLKSEDSFKITLSVLETALAEGLQKGIKAKALLLTNPTNPMGTILDEKEIKIALAFCEANELHCVFDEIYGNSIHSGAKFQSAFSGPVNRDRCHFVYGFSKDFTLAGFRVGIFHSDNEEVSAAMRALANFNNVSTDTQRAMIKLVKDENWIDQFFKVNQERLHHAYSTIKSALETQTEVKFWPAQAGVFAWADLRFALKAQTFEAETELYETLLNDAKVNILPGRVFHSAAPGWFRLCYAQEETVLTAAASRLAKVL